MNLALWNFHALPAKKVRIDRPRPRTDHCQTGSKCRHNDGNPIVVAMPENAPNLSKGSQHTYDRRPQTDYEKYSSGRFDGRGSKYCNVMCLLNLGNTIVKQSGSRSVVVGLKDQYRASRWRKSKITVA